MIYVTRLNHASVVLNSELIEYVETTPDTVISLTTGQKLMVLESADEVVNRVVQFRRSIQAGIGPGSRAQPPAGDVAVTATGAETHGGR
jgi:flagellar protein FlbD